MNSDKHGFKVDEKGLLYYENENGNYVLIKGYAIKRKWHKELLHKVKSLFKKDCDDFQ